MKNAIPSTRGFTLIELLVVISIVALLIAIMMPSLKTARETALSMKCQASMKQFGFAWANYAGDWKGIIPGRLFYWSRHKSYPTYLGVDTKAQAIKAVACPANPFRADGWTQQYSYFADGMIDFNATRSPADGFWVAETPLNNGASYTISVTISATPSMWFGHPNDIATNLFLDLHAAGKRVEEIPVTNDTGSYRYPGYTKYWRPYINNRLVMAGYPFSGAPTDPWN